MTEAFTARVIAVVGSIPAGKIMTYGQVAAVAGDPRGARQVARILHSCSERFSLPWQRVINSGWRVSLPDGEQEAMLRAEGVQFDPGGRVDPGLCLFTGPFPLSDTGKAPGESGDERAEARP